MAQFHGVQMGFGVLDALGREAIIAGGAAMAVGEVQNIDEFGDSYRIDTVSAALHHTDGTVETFNQAFPGPSTVLPGEAKQVLVLIRAAAGDTGLLSCVVSVAGVNATGGAPFSGTWGVGVQVVAA